MIQTEAEQLMWCGYGLMMCGRHAEALEAVERAKSMDPQHPPSFDWVYGQALFMAGRNHDAVQVLQAGSLLNSIALACRVAAYVEVGQLDEARASLPLFIEMRQKEFDCNGFAARAEKLDELAGGFRPTFRRAEDWERIASGLRAAGLPE